MLVRLASDEVLEIKRENLVLSQYLRNVYEGLDPLELVDQFLKKKSKVKKVERFIRQIFQGQSYPEIQDNKALEAKFKTAMEQEDLDTQTILNDVVNNYAEIFHYPKHRFPKIHDASLRLVVEFLNLPCPPPKHDDMLNNLMIAMQNAEAAVSTSFAELIEPWQQPYLDLLEGLRPDELMGLSAAAAKLAIKSLGVLLGVKMAQYLNEWSEEKFRQDFLIPQKFRHHVRENLEAKLQDLWTA